MASNKRPGSALSPRDIQDPKKIKKSVSTGRPEQNAHGLRRSGSSTPDSAKSTSTLSKVRPASHASESSSAPGNRPGSPTQAKNTKPAQIARPPLKVNTTSVETRGGNSGSPIRTQTSARPIPKKANTMPAQSASPLISPSSTGPTGNRRGSDSHPPRRGAAPMAPMMASPVTAITTTATSATLLSAGAPTTDCQVANVTAEMSVANLHDLVKLLAQLYSKIGKKDRLQERLETVAKTGGQTTEYQREVQAYSEETSQIEKQLVHSLLALKGPDDHDSNEVSRLSRRVQTLEQKYDPKTGALKAALSPTQISERPPGVVSHDKLKALIADSIREQLSIKLDPLKNVVSRGHGSATEESSSIESSPRVSGPSRQADIVKLQNEVENLKTFNIDITAKEERTNARVSTLEIENSILKAEISKLQDTVKTSPTSGTCETTNWRSELSYLKNSTSQLQRDKADKESLSTLHEKARSQSNSADNILSISTAVGKLQTEVKTVMEEVRRINKDASIPTDPRRKIFSSPATETSGQIDKLQERLDALDKHVQDLWTHDAFMQVQADLHKVQEDSQKYGRILDRHDEDIERFGRDLRADNTRINGINKDLSDLRSKVRKIDYDLDDLENEVRAAPHADNNDKTSSIDGAVKAVAGQTKAFGGEVKNMKIIGGQINSRQSDMTKLQSMVTSHEEELKPLSSKVLKRSNTSSGEDNRTILDALDSLRTAQDAQKKSADSMASRVKDLENGAANLEALDKTVKEVERKFSEHQANSSQSRDEVQQHFGVLEERQTSLQNNLKNFRAEIDSLNTKELRNDLASLKLETKDLAHSIKTHDSILQGEANKPGLVRQANDLGSTLAAMNQTSQQAPPAELASLEKRVAQVEEEVTGVRMQAEFLRIDFNGFDEAQAQQSELIEADLKKRVADAVARAVPSDRSTLSLNDIQKKIEADIKKRFEDEVARAVPSEQSSSSLEEAQHVMKQVMDEVEQFKGEMERFKDEIRQELTQISREATRRSASPTMREIEDFVFPKLEQSASTIVDEKLTGFNINLSRMSESLELLQEKYPAPYAEAVADMVLFSESQGKLSRFLPATLNAIRDLQTRFDNIQTWELAVHMLNALMPHISQQFVDQQFVQTIASMILAPVRESVRQFVLGQLRPQVENELQSMEQRINTASCSNAELANKNQQLREELQTLHSKIEDLERKFTMQGNEIKADVGQTNERVSGLDSEVERVSQVCTQLHTRQMEDAKTQSQERARLENETQEYKRLVEDARDQIGKLWADVEEHVEERKAIWEQLREHRDNIENSFSDIGDMQSCVGNLAKRIDPQLVPVEWLNPEHV